MKNICVICKEQIIDIRRLDWGKGEIHLDCYTPDKQVDYDIQEGKKNYSGEQSPYWDWVRQRSFYNTDDQFAEFPEANPDVLAEDEDYQVRRSYFQDLIEDTLALLSPRELQVYKGLAHGMNEQDIADTLKVSRSMVEKCRRKIKNKFNDQGIKSRV